MYEAEDRSRLVCCCIEISLSYSPAIRNAGIRPPNCIQGVIDVHYRGIRPDGTRRKRWRR
jgi:hypothetical protein